MLYRLIWLISQVFLILALFIGWMYVPNKDAYLWVTIPVAVINYCFSFAGAFLTEQSTERGGV